MSEDQGWKADQVSLCEGCAKHSEVRELVVSDLKEGICGACGATNQNVFNPKRFALLRNLIRALIRLHYSEDDYNHHWGGTSINEILLGVENPILEVASSDEYQDSLIERITSEGEIYPKHDEGIGLFAGSYDTGRGIQFSIRETANEELQTIELRLKNENFHAVETAMEKALNRIKADIETTVSAGTLWYRGRIGVEARSTSVDWREVTHVAKPYKGADIGALPPQRASANRLNRHGVSVLYVASSVETAVAELRPDPDHLVSTGGFRLTKELRVARFDLPIGPFASSDDRLELFALIYHIDTLLSTRVIPEERDARYPITQLLADVLIRLGFEGVMFRSSVSDGINLCAIDPGAFQFDEKMSTVKKIDHVQFRISDVKTSVPS